MRLTDHEQQVIQRCSRERFGADVRVLLFGSRIRDDLKGGDIDLYIVTGFSLPEAIQRKLALLVDLDKALGFRKIDVVLNTPDMKRKSIIEEAERTGIVLV